MSTLTTTLSEQESKSIFWKQVWALALLQAVNNFGFAAYYHYQPKLLERFNYTDFAMILVVLQGIIGIILNPIMGTLGDKLRRSSGKSFTLVSIGVNSAGMVFMAVAAAMTQETGTGFFHTIFPICVTLWLVTMAVFNSPSVSLLKSFAPNDELPKATAIMTLVGGLFATLHPFLFKVTDKLGLPITFALGGILLVGASNILRRLSRKVPELSAEELQTTPDLTFRLIKIFMIGLANGIIFNLFLDVIPAIGVKTFGKLDKESAEYIKAAVVFISAIVAWFASDWIKKIGDIKLTIIASIVLVVVLSLGIALPVIALFVVVVLLAGVIRSVLSISMLSYAMGTINKVNAGRGTGAFFCGVSAAIAISKGLLIRFKGQGNDEMFLFLQSIGLM